ncbi:integrase [Caldiplasma sukawensis]
MAECRSNFVYTMVRVYLNFLEENELLSSDDADYLRKVIPTRKIPLDSFVPSDDRVRRVYLKIDNATMKTAFLVLAMSGILIMEVVKMMIEFEVENLTVDGNIARFPMNYFRGHKNVLCVNLPRETALSIKRADLNDDTISHYFSELGLAPKYLRRWQYNFLIYQRVPEGVADFIQGISSESVASMHYLSKVKQADYWCGKMARQLINRFRKV